MSSGTLHDYQLEVGGAAVLLSKMDTVKVFHFYVIIFQSLVSISELVHSW
jgi:hypothetical protein